MEKQLSRRNLLRAASAGAIVLGFDPVGRNWISEASAASCPSLHRLPRLDGTVHLDPPSLQAAGDDFGHIVKHTPVAVLKPGSVEDVAAMVRYARRYGLKIAMRGQGHSTFGQSQAECGIVVDSSTLSTIHSIHSDRARVDAGVLWSDLLNATYAQGRTPPVLTDYLGLSVGGTLGLGGIGGTASHYGAQVDNVIELEVVTGRGDIEVCSRTHKTQLFNATLAGLGQCALIVRATVRLVPAKTKVTVYNLFYSDIGTYVDDQRLLLEDGRFDYLEGQVVPAASGTGFSYMIEAAKFYTPPAAPNPAVLLAGLSDNAAARQTTNQSYLEFAFRIEPLVALLKTIGAWYTPHPWFAVFVPASAAEEYVGNIVSNLTLADTGGGPVLFYPFRRDRVQRPLFTVPNEDFFTFNLLRFPPNDPTTVAALVAQNRAFYNDAVAAGGMHYPLGSIPLTHADWQKHYGQPTYAFFKAAKRWFDPDNVLTPGQGIFPSW